MGLGFLGKFLSVLARILLSRTLSLEAMGYYSLVSPTMLLFITLSQMGLPTAISTLEAKYPERGKMIFASAFFLSMSFSITLMILLLYFGGDIARILFQNEEVTEALYGLALLLPLVSLSALVKGFFYGKNQLDFTSTSTMMEGVGRILFTVFVLPIFLRYGNRIAAFGAMLTLCVGEIFQGGFLIFFNEQKLYKRTHEIMRIPLRDTYSGQREVLSLSFPLTLSRLVGSLTYFMEPILLTHLLLRSGMNQSEIATQYGVLSGYVLPCLMLPEFFSTVLANYLLPNLSKMIVKKDYLGAKKKFHEVLLINAVISLVTVTCLFFFGRPIYHFLYHIDEGYEWLKILSFPIVIFYLEAPIVACMHAWGLTKKAFYSTVISCIVRLLFLTFFTEIFGVITAGYALVICAIIDVGGNWMMVEKKWKSVINEESKT